MNWKIISFFQGWFRVVFGRVAHHRPAGLRPTQLCCNDHRGNWIVCHHTGYTIIPIWTRCHYTYLNSISHDACRVPEKREVVSLKHEACCLFCAAGGSSRTFQEMKPWDSSSLLGTRRAPSWFDRVRQPQVKWPSLQCYTYIFHKMIVSGTYESIVKRTQCWNTPGILYHSVSLFRFLKHGSFLTNPFLSRHSLSI